MKILMFKRKDRIKFFFRTKDGLESANWRFMIVYNKWNTKPFVKLHILIRTPLLCIERNNGGTQIGNKYVVWFLR